MRTYDAVLERDANTGLYVGHIPRFPGAHAQGETIDELRANLVEVAVMLLEDVEPGLDSELVAMRIVSV